MSKRFTETEKWRDPWFRKLCPTAKLLFLWLVDNCDKAGVIDLDLEAATFDIGQPINGDHLAELQGRWNKLPNGKLHLAKFVQFQYGTLSDKSTPHIRVLETLASHGINYPFSASQSSMVEGRVGSRVETTPKTIQDKRGKEKGGTGGKQFHKPTIEDVRAFCVEVGLPESDGDVFFWGKEAVAWDGVRDWKATIRQWKAAGYMTSQKQSRTSQPATPRVHPNGFTQTDEEMIREARR